MQEKTLEEGLEEANLIDIQEIFKRSPNLFYEETEIEELLNEYGRLYYCYTDDIGQGIDYQHAVKRMKEIIASISSREEKAREEGRKEGFKLGVEDRDEYWKAYPIEEAGYEAVTQYKEELLGKIQNIKMPPYPVENEKLSMLQEGAVIGFQDCLSEVKKLL